MGCHSSKQIKKLKDQREQYSKNNFQSQQADIDNSQNQQSAKQQQQHIFVYETPKKQIQSLSEYRRQSQQTNNSQLLSPSLFLTNSIRLNTVKRQASPEIRKEVLKQQNSQSQSPYKKETIIPILSRQECNALKISRFSKISQEQLKKRNDMLNKSLVQEISISLEKLSQTCIQDNDDELNEARSQKINNISLQKFKEYLNGVDQLEDYTLTRSLF